jgi:Protein of unknown function DUF262
MGNLEIKGSSTMALQEEILKQSAQIKTDSYQMSIGELLNLYRDGELDVHPEFQRVFRWSNTQKTRLIESILLGIPIPPIFVAQRKDGIWDVVDGVQRLSTIFQFVGNLKDEEKKPVESLILEKTKFLPSLEGYTWSGSKPFDKVHQLYIKRAKIDVNIVLKESDEKSKYELFMRLNTGGSALTAQEVRNCLMIMAYPGAYEWVKNLAESTDFTTTVSLSENDQQEQYPMELVTRFLTFRRLQQAALSDVADIGDYLNDALEPIHLTAQNKKMRQVEDAAFRETFRVLNAALHEDTFRRFNKAKDRFLGPFSIASFEVVAMGIGFNIAADGSFALGEADIVKKVKSIWEHAVFNKNSGSGVRASVRIPKIIPMGRKLFAP